MLSIHYEVHLRPCHHRIGCPTPYFVAPVFHNVPHMTVLRVEVSLSAIPILPWPKETCRTFTDPKTHRDRGIGADSMEAMGAIAPRTKSCGGNALSHPHRNFVMFVMCHYKSENSCFKLSLWTGVLRHALNVLWPWGKRGWGLKADPRRAGCEGEREPLVGLGLRVQRQSTYCCSFANHFLKRINCRSYNVIYVKKTAV